MTDPAVDPEVGPVPGFVVGIVVDTGTTRDLEGTTEASSGGPDLVAGGAHEAVSTAPTTTIAATIPASGPGLHRPWRTDRTVGGGVDERLDTNWASW